MKIMFLVFPSITIVSVALLNTRQLCPLPHDTHLYPLSFKLPLCWLHSLPINKNKNADLEYRHFAVKEKMNLML